MAEKKIITVLEPTDEYPHEPDPVANYNESMYFNTFDLEQEIGGWFRLGNRVNEGYAEMSVCLYLPNGQVGFMFGRPKISTNQEMNAGGLKIEIVDPFKELQVTYEGKICILNEPKQMANPRTAFKENPTLDCSIELHWEGMSPMFGGRPTYDDGSELIQESETSFAKAHYEQHGKMSGIFRIGSTTYQINGLGLRDKSWGPRYWQSINWYRWLPMVFSEDFAMMLSVISRDETNKIIKASGMVLEGNEYKIITDCLVDSVWDSDGYQTGMECWAKTKEGKEYTISGEVLSLIPLRNRRESPNGEKLHTRITEAMTRYTCNGIVGMGMSEYLDQIKDGQPTGINFNGR
ncbi:MAG: hypothetical protein VX594_09245 [Actinomycetota bacterium]|nr:hypothetical protein [Actinomycetota bacterium]